MVWTVCPPESKELERPGGSHLPSFVAPQDAPLSDNRRMQINDHNEVHPKRSVIIHYFLIFLCGRYNAWKFTSDCMPVHYLYFNIRPDNRSSACRFLTAPESFSSLAFHFRSHRSTVRKIVSECVDVIIKQLQPVFCPFPTKESLAAAADGFCKRWDFPNCIGACDGKHVYLSVS